MIGLCLAACSAGDGRPREAAHMDAKPVDQLVVAGNACGPAALLNSFRFGNDSWRGVYDSVKGDGEREKIRTVIRDIGMRPSRHLPGRARWSRGGVSVADLCRREDFSTATFYKWRAKYGGMDASDARRLRELEAENARLKKLLAEAVLDAEALKVAFGVKR